MFFQCFHDGSNRGRFLADRNVNTFYVLTLLVDDRVDRDRGLTGLSVPDDQLTLTSSDRDHRIDRLDTCLQRCINGFSGDNTGCHTFDLTIAVCLDRAFSVDRLSKGINNTSQHHITDGNLNNTTGRFHGIAFVNVMVLAEQYGTDIVFFQIHDHAVYITRKREKFTLHRILKSVNTSNTIGYLDYSTNI